MVFRVSFGVYFPYGITGHHSWYQRLGLALQNRALGVELRRSSNAITFLFIALTHVLVIGISGDLNSSLFYRRRPVKGMKYSISHEYRNTEIWFI